MGIFFWFFYWCCSSWPGVRPPRLVDRGGHPLHRLAGRVRCRPGVRPSRPLVPLVTPKATRPPLGPARPWT